MYNLLKLYFLSIRSSEVEASSPPVRKKAVWTKDGRSKASSSSVEESKEVCLLLNLL